MLISIEFASKATFYVAAGNTIAPAIHTYCALAAMNQDCWSFLFNFFVKSCPFCTLFCKNVSN